MINIIITVYFFASIGFSGQHFVPPIQRCILAEFCNHTLVPACGRDYLTTDIRLFIDSCDMEEYNCDYKTAPEPSFQPNRCYGGPQCVNKVSEYKEIDSEKCKMDANLVETTTHPCSRDSIKTSSTMTTSSTTKPPSTPTIITTTSSKTATTLVTASSSAADKMLMTPPAINTTEQSTSSGGNCTCLY